ncbi:MAG: hypothetical protein L0Y38_05545, partial [Methylococcaceae bacterium]|nr:hypothetical protein [Methylococcaceae bacterium]
KTFVLLLFPVILETILGQKIHLNSCKRNPVYGTKFAIAFDTNNTVSAPNNHISIEFAVLSGSMTEDNPWNWARRKLTRI